MSLDKKHSHAAAMMGENHCPVSQYLLIIKSNQNS